MHELLQHKKVNILLLILLLLTRLLLLLQDQCLADQEVTIPFLCLSLHYDCRVVYMEPLHFKEQIKVFASSQVLLMTHGAALVNILFMPEVSAVAAVWFCNAFCHKLSTCVSARVSDHHDLCNAVHSIQQVLLLLICLICRM